MGFKHYITATIILLLFLKSASASYCGSVPANVVYCVPIGISNYQDAATANSFQQMVNVNSLAYAPYEAGNLQNVEFFYPNGNVINSWLESGNSNTVTNTTYWLKLPQGLPPSSNSVIYLGFGLQSQNFFNGQTVGEAPQLSSTYGQYDDGANVFIYYNINPTSFSGWTTNEVASNEVGSTPAPQYGSEFGASNAFFANSVEGDYAYTSVPNFNSNEILTFWVYSYGNYGTNNAGLGDVYVLANSLGGGQFARLDTRGGFFPSGFDSTSVWAQGYNLIFSGNDTTVSHTWYKYDVLLSGSTMTAFIGRNSLPLGVFGPPIGSSITIQSPPSTGNYLGIIGDDLLNVYSDVGITYWNSFVLRYDPPNNVMPTATVATYCVINAIDPISQNCPDTESNSTITYGQVSNFSVPISGGIPPYTGNWIWSFINTESPISSLNSLTQAIPMPSADSGEFSLLVNETSYNSLVFSFNGVKYPANTMSASNTVFGLWTIIGNMTSSEPDVIVNSIATPQPASVAFNPSLPVAYVTNYGENTVSVIDSDTNSIVNSIPIISNSFGVAFSPANNLLAYVLDTGSITSPSNAVSVIDVATNTVVNTIGVGNFPFDLAFNPSGSILYVTNYESNTVSVINTATNTVINTIVSGSAPEGVAFAPNGNIAYVADHSSNTVNVINVATNTVINTISLGSAPAFITFNPSGTYAYVSLPASPHSTIGVIDVATCTLLPNQISTGTGSTTMAFNGNYLYVDDFYGGDTVSVINSITNQVVNTIPGFGSSGPFQIAFNPTNTFAYVSGYNTGLVSILGTSRIIVANTIDVEQGPLKVTISGNPGSAGFYSAVNITFTGTPTIGNQSAWSLYVNGALFGKTDSVMHWTEQGSPGTYSFLFKNPGNSNYTNLTAGTTLNVQSINSGGTGGTAVLPPTTSAPKTSTTTISTTSSTSSVSTTSIVPQTTTVQSSSSGSSSSGGLPGKPPSQASSNIVPLITPVNAISPTTIPSNSIISRITSSRIYSIIVSFKTFLILLIIIILYIIYKIFFISKFKKMKNDIDEEMRALEEKR